MSQLCQQAVVVETVWLVIETMNVKEAVGIAVEHVQQGHQRARLHTRRTLVSGDTARREAGKHYATR